MTGDRAEGGGARKDSMVLVDGGDFLNDIVASSTHNFFSRLKADYQAELRRALSTAIRQSQRQPAAAAAPQHVPKALRQAGTTNSKPMEPAAQQPARPLMPLQLLAISEDDAPDNEVEQRLSSAACFEQDLPASNLQTWTPPDSSPADKVEDALPGMTAPDAGGADLVLRIAPADHPSESAVSAKDQFSTRREASAMGWSERAVSIRSHRSKRRAGSAPGEGLNQGAQRGLEDDGRASTAPEGTWEADEGGPRKGMRGTGPAVRLLSDDDLLMLEEIKRDERRKRSAVEAAAHPDWVFHQMKSKATTASKKRAFDIVSSRTFDFAMGLVILLNSLAVGVETSYTVHGGDIPLTMIVIEHLFLIVYMFELGLRFHAVGMKISLRSNWVKFDTAIVAVGLASVVFTMVSLDSGSVETVTGKGSMLKMLRLVRLARTVRVVVHFRTLWLLVQGFMGALFPMLWTCLIMMLVVYVFSIIGMETIVGSSSEARSLEEQKNFHSMGSSILTFMQMMALDSTASIYRPLIEENWLLGVLFLAFFLVGPIALISIVTAVMVESSLRTANDDMDAKKTWEAERKRKMMPKLKTLLETLDADGSGDVVLEELLMAPRELQDQITHICDLPTLALEEVFHLLDVDGSGSLDIEEFVNGIIHSQQADKPSELLLLVQMSKSILGMLHDISDTPPERSDHLTPMNRATRRDTLCSAISSAQYRATLRGIS